MRKALLISIASFLFGGTAFAVDPLIIVTNGVITSITNTSVVSTGYVNSDVPIATTAVVYWATRPISPNVVIGWSSNVYYVTQFPTNISSTITGLTAGAKYYYRWYAEDESTNAWGESSLSFTTSSNFPAVIHWVTNNFVLSSTTNISGTTTGILQSVTRFLISQ